MIKLGNINISANPQIHFGLKELLHHLSSRDEFNVLYLSRTTILTKGEIYSVGVSEDDELGEEGNPRPDYSGKRSLRGSRFGFLFRNFISSGTRVVDNSLLYGNLLVRLPDVIRLLKKWESLGLAYSNGVSEVRKIFESEVRSGKQWIAFFDRDKYDPIQENSYRKDVKLWYDLYDTEIGKVIKDGLSKADQEQILKEVENTIKSHSFFLDLQIEGLLVEKTTDKIHGGATMDFDSVSSFDYEGSLPKISKDSARRFLNFNELVKRGVLDPAQKVLAFFDLIEGSRIRSPEASGYKKKYVEGPKDYFWELETRAYLDSGVVHLQPETYTIRLPGECSSTICLNLNRVLYRKEENPQAEVGIVFVGLLYQYPQDLGNLEGGDAEVTLVFVPYVAAKQKLALSAVPVEMVYSTNLSRPPIITGYSSSEPCGVSVHLFEKEKVNHKTGPWFQVVHFTRGEIVERDYNETDRETTLSTYSPSPILEVIVPDKNKINYSRAKYFDLDLTFKLVNIVKGSYPLAIEKISLFLKNQKDAGWYAEEIIHAMRLMLLKKFKDHILRNIDKLEKSLNPILHENRKSEDWQHTKNLCFKSADGKQKVEIDLGDVSKWELYKSPISLLFSRIPYHQGISRSGEEEVIPANVLKDIVKLGFDGKEKEVLGDVYRIIEDLGGYDESDEEDFFTLLSKRIGGLIKSISEIDKNGYQGPKCTLVLEYQPTILENAPNYFRNLAGSSNEALLLLMTSLYLAVDLEDSGLGIIVGVL